MSVILETKQLCKFYGAGENQVKAVNQVDIQICLLYTSDAADDHQAV